MPLIGRQQRIREDKCSNQTGHNIRYNNGLSPLFWSDINDVEPVTAILIISVLSAQQNCRRPPLSLGSGSITQQIESFIGANYICETGADKACWFTYILKLFIQLTNIANFCMKYDSDIFLKGIMHLCRMKWEWKLNRSWPHDRCDIWRDISWSG